MRIRLEPPRAELVVPAPLHSDYLQALKIGILPVFGIVREDGILVVGTVDRWNHLFRSKPPKDLVPGDVVRLGWGEARLVAYTPDYEVNIPSHEKEIIENCSDKVRLFLPSERGLWFDTVCEETMTFISERRFDSSEVQAMDLAEELRESKRVVLLPPHSRVSTGNRIVVETEHRVSWLQTQSIVSGKPGPCGLVYCTRSVFFSEGTAFVDKDERGRLVDYDTRHSKHTVFRHFTTRGLYIEGAVPVEYAFILHEPLDERQRGVEPFGAVTLMSCGHSGYRLGLTMAMKEEVWWLKVR